MSGKGQERQHEIHLPAVPALTALAALRPLLLTTLFLPSTFQLDAARLDVHDDEDDEDHPLRVGAAAVTLLSQNQPAASPGARRPFLALSPLSLPWITLRIQHRTPWRSLATQMMQSAIA